MWALFPSPLSHTLTVSDLVHKKVDVTPLFLLNKQTCSWPGSFPETAKEKAKFDLATFVQLSCPLANYPSYLESIKQRPQLSVSVVGEVPGMRCLQEAEAFKWSPRQSVDRGGAG